MKKAVSIALIKNGTVLFQLRDNKTAIMPQHWGLPSGEVNKDETLKQAIIREFQEETGYQLKDPILFAVDAYLEKGIKVKNHLFYEKYDGRQDIKCLEGKKMAFLSLKSLKGKKVIPRHDEYAQKAIDKVNKIKTKRLWQIISSKIVYQNPKMTVKEYSVIKPGGKKGIYSVLEKPTSCFIIPLSKNNAIYFIEEYRFPIQKKILQLPAGIIERGNILKSAKKELFQETGIMAHKLEKLGKFYIGAGHQTTFVYVVLATQLNTSKLGTTLQEGDEAILGIREIKIPKLKKMIKENKIKCGITLAALILFLD